MWNTCRLPMNPTQSPSTWLSSSPMDAATCLRRAIPGDPEASTAIVSW